MAAVPVNDEPKTEQPPCPRPDSPDSPFFPPYRSDTCLELPLVQLQPHTRMKLDSDIHYLHQDALMQLLHKAHACPEPLPLLVTRYCEPCDTDLLRSERMHAVLQLLSQIREHQHQALLRRIYKTFGSDHRKAAKELYARELFTTAYMQYWSLFTCLSCDRCRRLSAPDRHNLTVDLLEKLAVTCLRAGWLVDAANFADEALQHEKRSTRARMWLATAQLGLGRLEPARKNLAMLPRRGDFPREFPPWIEARVVAQREVLRRLEREARGEYDVGALEREAADRTPETPHSTALFGVEATREGYRVTGRVKQDAVLVVAPPLACAPCYTVDPAQADARHVPQTRAQSPPPAQTQTLPKQDEEASLFSLALLADAVFEQAKTHAQTQLQIAAPRRARTLHDEDPSLLSLALLADSVYTQAKSLPHVRAPVRAAAARCAKESERVIDLVGNDLRAAAIVVAQNYAMAVPHARVRGEEGEGEGDSAEGGGGSVCDRPAHAGHALYLPALQLLSVVPANTYATYHGPYLFLRAAKDLVPGALLTFDGFPLAKTALVPRSPASLRSRGSALAGTPTTSKASSRGITFGSP